MSDITTDFINATKKIHADVRYILTHIKLIAEDLKLIREKGIQKTDTISSSGQTDGSSQQRTDETPNRGTAVLNAGQSKGNENKSTDQKKSTLQRLVGWFQRRLRSWRKNLKKPKFQVEVLAIIGLSFYTCETHRTNNLTETSLNLVKDQQRPYVLATFHPTNGKPLEPNKAADFNIMLYNVGDSMAVNIRASKPEIRVGGKEVNEEARKCSIKYPEETAKEPLPPHQNPRNGEFVTLPTISTKVLDQTEYNSVTQYDAETHTFTGDVIVMWGGVEYTGLRGGDYSTEYCFIYLPSGNPVGECGYCKALR